MRITKPLCSLLGAKPALDIERLKAGRGWEVDLEGVTPGVAQLGRNKQHGTEVVGLQE